MRGMSLKWTKEYGKEGFAVALFAMRTGNNGYYPSHPADRSEGSAGSAFADHLHAAEMAN